MSPIEYLPKELIWSIIEYAPESVHHLRLASQTFHRRVNEYANFRSSDRSIEQPNEEVLIRGDYTKGLGEIHIRILIRVRMAGLFELRLKHRKLAAYASRTTGHMQWSYTSRIQYDCNEYVFILSESALLESLGQCIGSRISLVWALYFRCPLQFKCLSYLFRGTTITKYIVGNGSISQEIGVYILDLVKSCNIERLGICQGNVFISDPVQYLLELSSLVRSLYIMQESAHGIIVESNYFFGVKNADWGRIIVAMFERKLDKLCIWNRPFLFINNRSVDTLRERLPLLGKKVWMWLPTCDSYPSEFDYTLNEHRVTLAENELRIAHTSRQAENDCNYISF